jgi:hypothetical protein
MSIKDWKPSGIVTFDKANCRNLEFRCCLSFEPLRRNGTHGLGGSIQRNCLPRRSYFTRLLSVDMFKLDHRVAPGTLAAVIAGGI